MTDRATGLQALAQSLPFVTGRVRENFADFGRNAVRAIVEKADDGQRELLLLRIGTERLACSLLFADQVEQIVGDLEGHTDVATIVGELLDDRFAHAAHESA